MKLFAERLTVARDPGQAPEPDHYDEVRQVSVAADGVPFVEVLQNQQLVTLTEASGEGRDASAVGVATATSVTITFNDDERADEHQAARPWSSTLTHGAGEKPDSPVLTTETRAAPGEAPGSEYGLWSITKTAVPNEGPER